MKTAADFMTAVDTHLMEQVARVASTRPWSVDSRPGAGVSIKAQGEWSDYAVLLSVCEATGDIHVASEFACAPPLERVMEIDRLATCINDRLGLGGVEFEYDRGLGHYRYCARIKTPEDHAGREQLDAIIQRAISSCDMLFPVFLLVAWSETSAEWAMDIMLAEAVGNA